MTNTKYNSNKFKKSKNYITSSMLIDDFINANYKKKHIIKKTKNTKKKCKSSTIKSSSKTSNKDYKKNSIEKKSSPKICLKNGSKKCSKENSSFPIISSYQSKICKKKNLKLCQKKKLKSENCFKQCSKEKSLSNNSKERSILSLSSSKSLSSTYTSKKLSSSETNQKLKNFSLFNKLSNLFRTYSETETSSSSLSKDNISYSKKIFKKNKSRDNISDRINISQEYKEETLMDKFKYFLVNLIIFIIIITLLYKKFIIKKLC